MSESGDISPLSAIVSEILLDFGADLVTYGVNFGMALANCPYILRQI